MSIALSGAPTFVVIDSTNVDNGATDVTLTIEPSDDKEEGEYTFWIIQSGGEALARRTFV